MQNVPFRANKPRLYVCQTTHSLDIELKTVIRRAEKGLQKGCWKDPKSNSLRVVKEKAFETSAKSDGTICCWFSHQPSASLTMESGRRWQVQIRQAARAMDAGTSTRDSGQHTSTGVPDSHPSVLAARLPWPGRAPAGVEEGR